MTQRRVLAATINTLADRGFSRSSTLAIQQASGVSRGRMLHQFPSRDDLMAAAVQQLAVESFTDVPRQADIGLDPEARIDVAVTLLWATYDSRLFWAAMELWIASRHHPSLKAAIAVSERQVGSTIRDFCDTCFGEEICRRPGYPKLREFLVTSMRGAAMTYAFMDREMTNDPHVPIWKDLARIMLDV